MPCFEDYDLIKTIQICSFGSSQQADRVFLNAAMFIYMRENHRVLNITLKGEKKNHQPVRAASAYGLAPQLLRSMLKQRSGIPDPVFSGDDPLV